nr:MAG TPA_asm: hypothetical protein [Bacteriophage sp.]
MLQCVPALVLFLILYVHYLIYEVQNPLNSITVQQ